MKKSIISPSFYLILLLTLLTSSVSTEAPLRTVQSLVCPEGEYKVTDDTCGCCPGGKYSASKGASSCSLCGLGSYSSDCAKSCTPCDPGTYQPNTGRSSCIACPKGSACPGEKMTSHNKCEEGTYAESRGQTKCQDCPKGTYNPSKGASSCPKCDLGEYNDKEKQTECSKCPLNTFNPNMGSTTIRDCRKCPFRFYSTDPRTGGCEPCYDLCNDCETSSTYCTACIKENGVVLDGNTCVCKEFYALYYNEDVKEMRCVPCHRFCRVCHGPLANQCDKCNEAIGATMIEEKTCGCGPRTFDSERQGRCLPCHLYCKNCDGSSNRDCHGCNALHSYDVENEPTLCVSNCYDIQGYYLEGNICKGNLLFNC